MESSAERIWHWHHLIGSLWRRVSGVFLKMLKIDGSSEDSDLSVLETGKVLLWQGELKWMTKHPALWFIPPNTHTHTQFVCEHRYSFISLVRFVEDLLGSFPLEGAAKGRFLETAMTPPVRSSRSSCIFGPLRTSSPRQDLQAKSSQRSWTNIKTLPSCIRYD